MDRFSKFFTFEELTDSENHPTMVEANRTDALEWVDHGAALSLLLEEVRHILGDKPIKVNSGFRNAELNKAVGSKSSKSAHTLFKAADIKPLNISIQQAFELLITAKEAGQLTTLKKVLQEGDWLHVEVLCRGDVGEGISFRGFFVSRDGNKTWERVA